MKATVNEVVKYASHSVNQAGAVTLTMKAGFDQLQGSVRLLGMLNANITVKVKLLDREPFVLGMFNLKNLAFNQSGESTIKLVSLTEAIETGRLSDIVTMEMMQVKFEAEVDGE